MYQIKRHDRGRVHPEVTNEALFSLDNRVDIEHVKPILVTLTKFSIDRAYRHYVGTAVDGGMKEVSLNGQPVLRL